MYFERSWTDDSLRKIKKARLIICGAKKDKNLGYSHTPDQNTRIHHLAQGLTVPAHEWSGIKQRKTSFSRVGPRPLLKSLSRTLWSLRVRGRNFLLVCGHERPPCAPIRCELTTHLQIIQFWVIWKARDRCKGLLVGSGNANEHAWFN